LQIGIKLLLTFLRKYFPSSVRLYHYFPIIQIDMLFIDNIQIEYLSRVYASPKVLFISLDGNSPLTKGKQQLNQDIYDWIPPLVPLVNIPIIIGGPYNTGEAEYKISIFNYAISYVSDMYPSIRIISPNIDSVIESLFLYFMHSFFIHI
jgi:hypothetical protein